MYKVYIAFFACCFLYGIVCAQTDSLINKLPSVADINSKTIVGLQKQYAAVQTKLDKQSVKLLSGMQHSEDKLQRKLNGIDTLKAQALFTNDIKQRYSDLQSSLSQATDKLNHFPLKEYMPGLDSVQTSLSFLTKNTNLPTGKIEQLKTVTSKLESLEGELQKANDVQAFIREREAQLKEQLVNTGLARQLKGINQEVFYYQQQLSGYKSLLNDKEKLKDKLLETVRTLPAFQKFWQKNSYLAALFPTPANVGTPQALAGLQTRADVQAHVEQRFGASFFSPSSGGGGFQQQVDAAQGQLSQLKDKVNHLASSLSKGEGVSSDMTMPDFKPNDQKTKSFLKRLEYGLNIQSEAGRYTLPAMSDIALTLGYKLSDNKSIGIGASYKLGWGTIKHIEITSEGVGLRSYLDIKVPTVAKGKMFGGLWFSGGFEYNYLSSFRNIQELHRNVDVWQRSALMGISKKYKVGKKECNMQLLYDFLHNRQTPPGTAFKFRVGYTF